MFLTFALTLALVAAQAPTGDVTARFSCRPDAVEVGEPFELVLELSHPREVSVFDALESDLELDATWIVLGEERHASEPDPTDPGRGRTRRVWTLASLEPSGGAPRVLSEVLAGLVFRADVTRIETALARVDVTSVLGDEDAPRPLAAFPEGFGREAPILERSPWVVAAGAATAFFWLLFLALYLRSRRRRPAAPRAALTPLESLSRLSADVPREPEAVRERYYELKRLLRRSFEERFVTRAGLTDAEWIAALRGARDLPPAAVEQTARLVEEAERVKYAGGTPSDWALQETFAAARGVLEALSASAGPTPREGAA